MDRRTILMAPLVVGSACAQADWGNPVSFKEDAHCGVHVIDDLIRPQVAEVLSDHEQEGLDPALVGRFPIDPNQISDSVGSSYENVIDNYSEFGIVWYSSDSAPSVVAWDAEGRSSWSTADQGYACDDGTVVYQFDIGGNPLLPDFLVVAQCDFQLSSTPEDLKFGTCSGMIYKNCDFDSSLPLTEYETQCEAVASFDSDKPMEVLFFDYSE